LINVSESDLPIFPGFSQGILNPIGKKSPLPARRGLFFQLTIDEIYGRN
jgi:hypothetical protein